MVSERRSPPLRADLKLDDSELLDLPLGDSRPGEGEAAPSPPSTPQPAAPPPAAPPPSTPPPAAPPPSTSPPATPALPVSRPERKVPRRRWPTPSARRPTPPSSRTSASPHRLPWILVVLALPLGLALGYWLKPDPAMPVWSVELLDFGETRLHDGGAAPAGLGLAVELTNAGERALSLGEVAVDGEEFSIVREDCGGRQLVGRQSCRVEVAFAPTATGPRLARLRLAGDEPGLLRPLPLLGRGVAPQLELSPLEHDFGSQLIGTASRTTLRLTNRGSAPVDLPSFHFTGRGAADFVILGDACSGRVLEPGERCALQVSFMPTGAGPRQAELRLRDAPGGTALTSPPRLTGLGRAPEALLTHEPQLLEFAPQIVESRSAPRVLTFKNEGTGAVRIAGFRLAQSDGAGGEAGPASFEVDPGPCIEKPLAPGEGCRIEVRFRPRTEGEVLALLEVDHDAGEGRRIPVSGRGAVPRAALDRRAVDFGEVPARSSSESEFLRLSNHGSGPLEVSSIRLQGSGAQAFTARPVGCTAAPIEPNTSCGIEVQFRPRRSGRFQAIVEVRHNGPDSPLRIELEGRGER